MVQNTSKQHVERTSVTMLKLKTGVYMPVHWLLGDFENRVQLRTHAHVHTLLCVFSCVSAASSLCSCTSRLLENAGNEMVVVVVVTVKWRNFPGQSRRLFDSGGIIV